MSLDLTFLGTGGAFTDFRTNYHNNAIVHTDAGPVLIDCGGTAVQSLKELGIKPWEIAGVIITHMHGDHVGGLEQLLWERFYTSEAGGPGWLQTPIFTTNRIHDALRRCLHDCVDEITTPDGTHAGGYERLVQRCVLPGDGSGMVCGDVWFQLKSTPHVVGVDVNKPCYGVWIRKGPPNRENRIAYYTSDTTFRPNLGIMFPEADVIFHDCSFGPKYPGTVHTHYEELMTLPRSLREQIVLMHHTQVPEGVDPVADGFRAAAQRHQTFTL